MSVIQGALQETASQTAGPYVHIGLVPVAAGLEVNQGTLGLNIVGSKAEGERIRVEGRVFDGANEPVKDAVLEVWQADAAGHYAHPQGGGPVEEEFLGWGRISSDFETGVWGFDTIKPGAVPGQDHQIQAPHLNFWLIARGINIGLCTRMYFPEENGANAHDPVLRLIKSTSRRETLIAQRCEYDGKAVYRFDIWLQGKNETVFFSP